DSDRWNGLNLAVERSKLLPIAEGFGGLESRFGTDIDQDGARALIGAMGLNETGGVIVMEYDGSDWQEQATLFPSDGLPGDGFGMSVSLDGDRALIGSVFHSEGGLSVGAAYIFDFDGLNWNETAKLLAGDGQAGDSFGAEVSLDGDQAMVGALGTGAPGPLAGGVYVFENEGSAWAQTAKLTASDADSRNFFGLSIDLENGLAVIGARDNDEVAFLAGAAYVFEQNGANWNEVQKLTASDPVSVQNFGVSVSLSGNRLAVGARGADGGVQDSGAVYMFERQGGTWVETAKLTASDAADSDQFGDSVSLDGNRVLIGARDNDDQGSNSGAAYIFTFHGTQWVESIKLLPLSGAAEDRFGSSVSLSGEHALVGALDRDIVEPDTGSVASFEFTGLRWVQTGELQPALDASNDRFGFAVALEGDRALVGAELDDDGGVDAGSAYIFDFDGVAWNLTQKLIAADAEPGDRFGYSVALSGNRAVIGAPREDQVDIDTGAAYVFEFDGLEWTQTAKLTPIDGGQGDFFGDAVGIADTRVLIGSPGNTPATSNSGAVYVYEFVGSSLDYKEKLVLPPPMDPTPGGRFFGTSISIEGNRALIGASFDSTAAPSAGAAFVFEHNGSNWIERAQLLASDAANGDTFGSAVSLSGNRALVGAALADRFGQSNTGTAYIFEFDGLGWSQTEQLLDPALGGSDGFALAVSLAGERALIGAPFGADAARGVYLFEFDGATWNSAPQQLVAAPSTDIEFGRSVSISGDRYLIGAPGDDERGTNAGAAYIFDENQPPLARPDELDTDEDSAISGNVLVDNGLGPDGDGDGDPLTVVSINGASFSPGAFLTLPSGALLSMEASGSFQYDPNGQFESLGDGAPLTTDSFSYSISDGFETASAIVRIDISGVDDPPVAVDDLVILTEDDPATGILVLLNDTDVDGGPIAVASVTQPAEGFVEIINNGSRVTYRPDPDTCNNGEPFDSFTYTLTPGGSSATVSALVECLNDAPNALDASVSTPEDTDVFILLNGTDPEGDALAFQIQSGPSSGNLGPVVVLDETTARVRFTPESDLLGTESFTFRTNDGTLSSPIATVTIDVIAATDLTINATADAQFHEPGQLVTFQVTVSNPGPSSVTGALVNLPLPIGLEQASWTCTGQGGGSCASSGSVLVDEPVDLPEGGSVEIAFSATVLPEFFGDLVATATVTAPAGLLELDGENNTASSSVRAETIFRDRFEEN
ncbi:MAG: Ig-like domain-containing protein, partial [Wenzhouxiangella sp.]|nr:Ig-like domain-containing protein [Wenzhouxiangella sp.]